MATQTEIQTLLRFLAQDAKVPLKDAMGKIKDLQQAKLTRQVFIPGYKNNSSSLAIYLPKPYMVTNNISSPSVLSTTPLPTIQAIFPDPKLAKQILSAAKRVSKKRTADSADNSTSTSPTSPTSKRQKLSPSSPTSTASALTLPTCPHPLSTLLPTRLLTNRAPLLLAFTLALLAHTRPAQPLSSRLSLAQAVVSATSRRKATHIGLRPDGAASEDVLLEGLRRERIMGREIGVLRRAGVEGEGEEEEGAERTEPALWGVDVDALQGGAARVAEGAGGMPLHTPEAARAYLGKSFWTLVEEEDGEGGGEVEGGVAKKGGKKKAKTGKALVAEREENLGMVLAALEALFRSWTESVVEEDWHGLGMEELERRAWGWYVRVRPEVKEGRSGWGEKGEVKLGDILALRRPRKEKAKVSDEKTEAQAG